MRETLFTAGLVAALIPAALAQTPAVPGNGVVNAATFAQGQAVAPGGLISIFGTALASTTGIAGSIPLSTSLSGVSVTFNGTPAPLIAVFPPMNGNPAQINAQLPWEVAAGSASVVVTNNGASSTPTTIQVNTFSPGIFSLQFGTGQAAALIFPDNALAAPAGSIPGALTRPAKVGDVLTVYATGLGPVSSQPATGNTPSQTATTTTVPTVLIGNVSAPVQFSGLSPQFVGVYQLNITVPSGVPSGNAVPLQIQVGGITTTNQVTIAVQ